MQLRLLALARHLRTQVSVRDRRMMVDLKVRLPVPAHVFEIDTKANNLY
jgi:hypothetical protein